MLVNKRNEIHKPTNAEPLKTVNYVKRHPVLENFPDSMPHTQIHCPSNNSKARIQSELIPAVKLTYGKSSDL